MVSTTPMMIIITMPPLLAQGRLKSPVSRLFTQPFVHAQITETTKAPRHWPLWGEITGYRWIPRTKGTVTRRIYPFDDVKIGDGCGGWLRLWQRSSHRPHHLTIPSPWSNVMMVLQLSQDYTPVWQMVKHWMHFAHYYVYYYISGKVQIYKTWVFVLFFYFISCYVRYDIFYIQTVIQQGHSTYFRYFRYSWPGSNASPGSFHCCRPSTVIHWVWLKLAACFIWHAKGLLSRCCLSAILNLYTDKFDLKKINKA